MGEMRQISVTLPSEVVDALRAKVESGEYASESEAICDGLLALDDHHYDIEDWLRTEVAATYDAMIADPSRGIPIEDVKAALAAHRAKQA